MSVKVVCVGDGSTGKTSLLMSYVHNDFEFEYIPTCFDNTEINLHIDGSERGLTLWDTAGAESYDRLRTLCYPDTHVFIITFAFNYPDSFNNVREKWLPEIQHYCPRTPFFIVCTKVDARSDEVTLQKLRESKKEPISSEQGQALAKELGARYFETSSKTGQGIRTLFETAVRIKELPVIPFPSGKSDKCSIC